MSIRPRTLVPLVVVAFLIIGVAGCSNGQASVTDAGGSPGTEDTDPASEEGTLCSATATVNGTTYHVVRAVSQDYGVKPTVQLDGSATSCAGDGEHPMTFHPIPHVDPTWALCGLVEGQWRVFVADELGPVPQDSQLARIVVGD